MLAQQHEFDITAIEINKDASQQAIENIATSNFHSQIKIVHGDLRSFTSDKKFDLIISNPPFFEDDLKSDNNSKNAAMHSTELTIKELLDFVSQNLSKEGYVALLIPFHRSDFVEKLFSNHSIFIVEKCLVKQSINHDYFRLMYLLSPQNNHESICKEISIYDASKQYTSEFVELLKPYYLYL
jgi:tRNA1Val (adenine37-N6)-methyltransferase